MDKTVNTRDDVCKSTECCKTDDCSLNNCSLRIIILKNLPRIIFGILEAERNLLCFFVDVLYVNINCIAYINNSLGCLMCVHESSEM